MAGSYLEKINYEIKEGKKYFVLTLKRTDWMKNITATVDGKEINPKVETIERNGEEEKGKITFEIGSLDSKVMINMDVVPMGNVRVGFRIVPEKDTVKLIQEYKEETPETKPEVKPEEIGKNGLYELTAKTLKEKSDEESMAGSYLEKINYEIKDGKKYFILTLKRTDWMKNITATVDGKEINPTVETIERNGEEEKGKITFEIAS